MALHDGIVPEWLNEKYVEEALRVYYKQPDLAVKKLNISAATAPGDNYVCQVYRIKVLLGNNKELSLIGKYQPVNKTTESLGATVFDVEAAVFQKLVPLFLDEPRSVELGRTLAPELYHSDRDRLIIIMEDLVDSGYVKIPRKELLNLEQCLTVVKKAGSYHAASLYALRKDPSLKQIFQKGLYQADRNTLIVKWLEAGFRSIKKYIADHQDLPERWKKGIAKIEETVDKDWLKVCFLREECLNVLCHGDLSKINMMFNPKENSVKFYDFQQVQYNCFGNDLQFFLFTGVQPSVLAENLDIILSAYQESLSKHGPVDLDLSIERIRKEFNERLLYGFILALFSRCFMILDQPPDLEVLLGGGDIELGFDRPEFREELNIIMPLFEKHNVI